MHSLHNLLETFHPKLRFASLIMSSLWLECAPLEFFLFEQPRSISVCSSWLHHIQIVHYPFDIFRCSELMDTQIS